MRTFVRSALIAVSLTVVGGAAAYAQVTDTMKFTTTFPFTVGHQSMPAGSYTVTPLEIDHSLLEISNGRQSALLLTERDMPRSPSKQDEVVFTKQGGSYVLHEIWDAATDTGAEAIPPHARQNAHEKAR